jgi:hypothetical protein
LGDLAERSNASSPALAPMISSIWVSYFRPAACRLIYCWLRETISLKYTIFTIAEALENYIEGSVYFYNGETIILWIWPFDHPFQGKIMNSPAKAVMA